ncbi:MAG: xanthine dehydrogenase family protein molybdopterin-binding subunit [Anaerolineales bacterium]|nr:MAG: xanthine dehydrogenase family protein molybdopterin-binding subunit [Anaerolineales bacterium]
MTYKVIGKRVKRVEDPRLLTGEALFVGDVNLPNMLHAAFLRSDYAHARIKSIDISRAKEIPGVVGVYTAEDMGDAWEPGPPLVSPPPTLENVVFNSRRQVPLVRDKVKHAGEIIAVVVAESRYIAEDAVEEIFVDYEPLPAVVDLEKCMEPGHTLVHDDLDSNLAAHLIQNKGDYEAARADADYVLKRKFHLDRGAAVAMENRGLVVDWDQKNQHLMVWDATQSPIPIRNGMAARLGLRTHQVRVVAPFVGGGFGPKIMMFYAEEMVLPWLTMKLNRPVKWIEDRKENFYATTQERQQIQEVEMALSKEGRILGIKQKIIHDTGAYDPYGLTTPLNTQSHSMGPYDVQNYNSEVTVVFTNKTIVTPVRGAGRPQGIYIVERMLDIACKELKLDGRDVRRLNFIPPEAFPYDHTIIDQAFTSLMFDSGNFQTAYDKALEKLGYDHFIQEEQPRLRAEGKHIGIGIVPFIETTGVGPYEGARVAIEPSGKVSAATGVGTQGQSHMTTFAQIIAEELGVEVEDVSMVTGDTAEIHWGTGTFASRGAVVAGNAVLAAASDVKKKVLKLASKILETPEDELELDGGLVRVADIPEQSISLGELAVLANPFRGAVEPGTEPGLESTKYFGPAYGATAFGVHGMILEVDPETMMIKFHKYVTVEDCGTMINPLVVEGQIHGGVSMGIGNCYYEKLHYDENGQLLNASLADYLIPTSAEMPHIETYHQNTPAPNNKLGTKGVGEAGTIPVPAAFAQALENALPEYNLEILETPLSPNRLFELLHRQEDES